MMEKISDLENYPSKQKAIDRALWLNFKHRLANYYRFGVMPDNNCGYHVVSNHHESFEESKVVELTDGYSDMTYSDIENIRTDSEQLHQWEEIAGMFTVIDGEILRFILAANVPLEKFIRYELACRGHDKDHRWCGFEKAREIWLE